MIPGRFGTFDIETLPGTYRAFAENMYEAKLMKETVPIKLASVAIKPLHLKTVVVLAYWQFPTYKAFLKAVWEECDKYEYLIGHNAKKFDLRSLNDFFVQHGLKKIQCKIIDTVVAVRREFRWPSYRLKDTLLRLGIGEKMETGGESLWFAVEAGDKKARKHFLEYNANDTIQTEKLYIYLRDLGYIKEPRAVQCYSANTGCVRCGGTNVEHRGEKPYKDGPYKMVRCKDCNKHQPYYRVRMWPR